MSSSNTDVAFETRARFSPCFVLLWLIAPILLAANLVIAILASTTSILGEDGDYAPWPLFAVMLLFILAIYSFSIPIRITVLHNRTLVVHTLATAWKFPRIESAEILNSCHRPVGCCYCKLQTAIAGNVLVKRSGCQVVVAPVDSQGLVDAIQRVSADSLATVRTADEII